MLKRHKISVPECSLQIDVDGVRLAVAREGSASVSKFEAGHAAFLEQREAFIREFLNFIRSLDKTAPQTSFAAPIKYRGEGYERSNSACR